MNLYRARCDGLIGGYHYINMYIWAENERRAHHLITSRLESESEVLFSITFLFNSDIREGITDMNTGEWPEEKEVWKTIKELV